MYTTITRASFFDALCDAVDEARAKSAGDTAWLNAIDSAWNYLLENETYEVVDPYSPHAAVRIPSATNAHVTYTANGACQCEAFDKHIPCWHRAASRLVRNAMQRSRATVRFPQWDAKSAGRSVEDLVSELY